MASQSIFQDGALLRLLGKPQGEWAPERKLVKGPLSLEGSQFSLLSELLPHFPDRIATFYDLFAGTASVAINCTAERVFANDVDNHLVGLYESLQKRPFAKVLKQIRDRVRECGLDGDNEKGWKKLVARYEKSRDPIDLYVLACHAARPVLRFNFDHRYTSRYAHGKNRFSRQMENRLAYFAREVRERDIRFACGDFTDIDLEALDRKDLVYCDPPNLLAIDEKKETALWDEVEETALHAFLDDLHKRKLRFALSGFLSFKGRKNLLLETWLARRRYRVIPLGVADEMAMMESSGEGAGEGAAEGCEIAEDRQTRRVLVTNMRARKANK